MNYMIECVGCKETKPRCCFYAVGLHKISGLHRVSPSCLTCRAGGYDAWEKNMILQALARKEKAKLECEIEMIEELEQWLKESL